MDYDIPIKQELIEESEMNHPMKTEENNSNPYLIENVESYLKYCCPECAYSSKDVHDFSIHVSKTHSPDNMTNQTSVEKVSINSHHHGSMKNLVNTEWGKCVVPNCTNVNSFQFLKFPKQQQKLDLWLQLCGLQMVKRNDRICADHFNNTDLIK